MKNKDILVSIGTAVYNGENYLREALDSVLAQTYTNFELIISDNASTDKTEEICKEYARKDPRIRYVRQPENRGIRINADFVLHEAKGAYYAWLHHDDVLEKDFLEKCVDYLSKHPECFMVTGDFKIINKFGELRRIEKLENIRDHIKWKFRSREFFRCPMTHASQLCIYGLFRTERTKPVFRNSPNPNTIMGAENYLISRFAVEGQIASIPYILRKFRRHKESIYRMELAKIQSARSLVSHLTLSLNIYKIRFDQIKVLMGSNYPLLQKLYILAWAYMQYLKSFLELLFVRIPKKLVSLWKN